MQTLLTFKESECLKKGQVVETLRTFKESEYKGELLPIGKFLSSIIVDASLSSEEAQKI